MKIETKKEIGFRVLVEGYKNFLESTDINVLDYPTVNEYKNMLMADDEGLEDWDETNIKYADYSWLDKNY